jgi:hypothetical protein
MMGAWRRRAVTTTVATGVALAMSATSALAHFCYQDARSARGNEKAASSQAWTTMQDFAGFAVEMGWICQDGADAFLDYAEMAGFDDKLLHTKAVLAGGALHAKGYSGKGVGHIPEAAFDVAEAACMDPEPDPEDDD